MEKKEYVFNTGETPSELRQKYNPDGSILRRFQLRMLDMLIYIDNVCKEQNIIWRLDSGNILGAVRHGGFIPWDDDVDIVVSPKEFKRLVKYLKEHPHPQYVLQDNDTDKGYYSPNWAVLRDTKSEYIKKSYLHNARKYRGAQIDIFCYDTHVNKILYELLFKITWKNVCLFIGRNPRIAQLIYDFQIKILIPLCKFIGYPFSSGKHYCCAYGFMFHYRQIPEEILYPTKPLLFEGHFFPGPNNVDAFLKQLYGNYMNLPDINNRSEHHCQYKIWD